MELKLYISGQVDTIIKESGTLLKKAMVVGGLLPLLDINDAVYRVKIRTSWSGEKDTMTVFSGSLEGAIHQAEGEFMAENNRSDVQGEREVYLLFGQLEFPLPEGYWKKYTQKNKNVSQE